MNKYWTIQSGVVLIDEESLYDFLFLKGFRCFKIPNEEHRFILIFIDNTVTVYPASSKLWRFCCMLLEEEFTSIEKDEMYRVIIALRKCKGTLKKRYLTQLEIEELEKSEESESKQFLQNIIEETGVDKGDANGD
jgi:hypothetical protein